MRKLGSAVALALLAGVSFGFAASAETLPAKAYVRRGLVAQWDGIENVGEGQHSATATEWVELTKGTIRLPLTDCVIGEDSVTLPTGTAANPNVAQSVFLASARVQPCTYELYWGAPNASVKTRDAVLLMSDLNYFYRNSDSECFFIVSTLEDSTYNKHFSKFAYTSADQKTISTVSLVNPATKYTDAVLYANGTKHVCTGESHSQNQTVAGRFHLRNVDPGYDVIYKSVRVYDCALGEDELAVNRAIDRVRFEGATSDAAGVRYDTAKQKTEIRLAVTFNSSFGSVTADGVAIETGWAKWTETGSDETVELEATAASECTFVGWEGLPDGIDPTQAKVSVPTKLILSVVAKFAGPTAQTLHWRGGTAKGLASEPTNWAELALPKSGDAIMLDAQSPNMTWDLVNVKPGSWTQEDGYAGTVTFDTGLETVEVAGNVTLDGGTWTHAENPSCTSSSAEWKSGRGMKQLIVSCGGDFTLGAAAKIDVVGKGYAAGQGPGCNVNGGNHGGAGASHGGAGVIQTSSYYSSRNIGPCYGSAKAPVTIGSGGGGARGGGAVRLAVGGKLDVRGPITAKGADTTSWYAGSGGSIYLSAAEIVGAGPLCAAGGAATNDSGGGGGRIALYVTGEGKDYADYTGELDVSAFAKSLAPFCGTVYRENKADNGRGELWIKGYNAPTSKIPDPLELSYQTRGLYGTFVCDTDAPIEVGTLKLTGHARLHVPSNVVLSVTGFESENDGAWTNRVMLLGGKLSLAKDTVVTDLEVAPFWEPSDIVFDDDVTDKTLKIANGGRISPAIDMTLHGDLRILSGGAFSHYLGYPIALTVPSDCTIDEGGAIDVSGRGYVKDTGPGKSTIGQTGGSHGGRGNGGNPTGDNGPGNNGSCYGSVTAPVTMGSGGRYGTGGGAIKLTVADTLTVNGAINANGGYSDHYSGAGGSAWILTKRLLGSGPISANGGLVSSGGERNGTGGGGRVAVWMTDPQYDFSEYTGAITAYGGSKPDGKIYGGAGTVYRKLATEAQNEGTLVIDNGLTSQYKNYECRVDPLVTDADVGTVIVTNNATFAVTNGAAFTFRKQWIVSSNARFRGYPGSTVVCAPCGTKATMSGESTFYNFTCDAPGKTIEFDVNATCFGVAALGTLTLQGDETAPLTLASSVEETPWLVKADGAAVQAMKCLTVIDSDATAGALMVAENATGTRCSGWNFVNVKRGETLSWTGLAGTGWTDPGNWDGGRAPSPTDNLVVTNAANQPVLNADVTAWSITVAEGASLALNGFSVAVSNLTVAGSLTATGTEILEVTKNVDFTGGTFAAARSTLRLVGAADQSVTAGGVVFRDVIIEKDGGLLAFADAFAADRVRLTAVQPMAVTFAAGKLFAAREITFAGLLGNAAGLRLASSSEGSAWLLKASDYAFAAGVSVSDSDARSGLAFRTGAPSEGTNCEGWDFSAAPFVWTGAADAYFTNAANWAGGVAPGAADDVRLDAAGEIVLDAPLKLRSMEIGGGAAVVLTVNEPLELSAGLVVDANGTFVANTNVAVGGTVIVRKDGVVTHGANGAEPVNKLSLAVRGDVLIEEDGKITAYAKGYAASWKGPGSFGYGREAGPSHGGRGCGTSSGSVTKDCYGSAFQPETFGTSGNKAGGGVIRMTVDGTLTVDGVIDADGEDNPNTEGWYSGAGGSVWLTAGRLLGDGVIRANGGKESKTRPGGGGRVAIYLTQDTELNFDRVEAKGGRQDFSDFADKIPLAAAGTVYVQCAGVADGAGQLIVDAGRTTQYLEDIRVTTDLPAADGETARAFENATLVIRNYGCVRLTADVTVDELEFPTGRIFLNGHTLTIRSLKHRKRSNPKGYDYTGAVVPGAGGAIRFLPRGLMLFVR